MQVKGTLFMRSLEHPGNLENDRVRYSAVPGRNQKVKTPVKIKFLHVQLSRWINPQNREMEAYGEFGCFLSKKHWKEPVMYCEQGADLLT